MLEPYEGKLCAMKQMIDRGSKKKSSPSELGRTRKGAVNVAKTGTAACKSRTASNARNLIAGLPQVPW